MQERKNPLSFTLQQVAEIISTTRGDRHRSTVRDKQLCCHWNGNTIPFVVLYHGTYQALLSWPALLPHRPVLPSSSKEKARRKKNQVSPFQGQEMDENSALGEKKQTEQFGLNPAQLSSLHQRNFCTVQNLRTRPRISTKPQPEVACACLDTCLCQLFLLKA